MKGHEKLILTGQLGNVMKESAEIALSYLRSKADDLGLPENFSQNTDIHVHVPSGAIPTTTSGKIRRAACAEQYLQDEFTRLDA